jgi:hypothetical protein
MPIRVLPITVILAIAACSNRTNMTEYRAVHLSAKQSLPIAVQMEELFGDADHFITHFGFSGQKSNTWNTEVYFDGRYTLTMQVEILINYSKKALVVSGNPKFYLHEVIKIDHLPDGRIQSKYGMNREFTAEEWTKLYENKGDFSVIGIELRDDPLSGFDEYEQGWRSPRIPISLLEKKTGPKRPDATKKEQTTDRK